MKRKDYLSWEEYFMGLAILSAERSKDPSTQVGACIVDENNKIISVGYNGAPIGYDDDKDMTWERDGDFLDTKYAYVCHSELNAILNSRVNVEGCKLFVTLFPCNECAKVIIQSGIKTVIYAENKYDGTPSVEASKRLMNAAGVRYYQYQPTGKKLEINV